MSLDDEPLEADNSEVRPEATRSPMCGFEEDWKLLKELMEDGIVISADDNDDPAGKV